VKTNCVEDQFCKVQVHGLQPAWKNDQQMNILEQVEDFNTVSPGCSVESH